MNTNIFTNQVNFTFVYAGPENKNVPTHYTRLVNVRNPYGPDEGRMRIALFGDFWEVTGTPDLYDLKPWIDTPKPAEEFDEREYNRAVKEIAKQLILMAREDEDDVHCLSDNVDDYSADAYQQISDEIQEQLDEEKGS